MAQKINVSKRRFLMVSTLVGGSLVFGIRFKDVSVQASDGSIFSPNVWVAFSDEQLIEITLAKSEMGQGVMTALPMLIAEEMDVDWNNIKVFQADQPLAAELGDQSTGGSGSVKSNWLPLRQAGAAARMLFIQAAANRWSVPVSQCRTESGVVFHDATTQSLLYGELLRDASKLEIPADVTLKKPEAFKYIGQPLGRLDLADKITGKAKFGADIHLPGMLTAVVQHSPVFGGRLKQYDAVEALKVHGVKHVIPIHSGIAVVAENFWAAQRGVKALNTQWDEGEHKNTDSAQIRAQFKKAAEKNGAVAYKRGDVNHVTSNKEAIKLVKAEYELPFQAHATMEPMSCTAYCRDWSIDVWAPTQSPRHAYDAAVQHGLSGIASYYEKIMRKITGSALSSVKINTTQLGCGFGRRLQQDYVGEAVAISKAVDGPVKLMWSREEDMQHDYYRPANHNIISAHLDKQGMPMSWHHKIVSPSIAAFLWPGSVGPNDFDHMSVEGATKLPYVVPNVLVEHVQVKTPLPVGMWRSVGHSHNAFVVESFIDELAAASDQDPLEYRLKLLDNNSHKTVLQLAADKAGWGTVLPSGHFHGLAVHYSYYSYVAQIVQLSVQDNGGVKVHKVTCAIDCGTVVNPDIVRAQMEGAIAYGLTAALKGEITLKQGKIAQSNFHNYPILRMNEMPDVDVHFVSSNKSPTGVGEPGVPPIAPAIANAVFKATNKRIRRLPII